MTAIKYLYIEILSKKINGIYVIVRDPIKQHVTYKAGSRFKVADIIQNRIYWQRLQDDGIVKITTEELKTVKKEGK